MNIVEALKTGYDIRVTKAFCYMSDNIYDRKKREVTVSIGIVAREYFLKDILPGLSEEFLLSDMWEVRVPTVEISADILRVILGEALHINGIPVLEEFDDVLKYMNDRLGL